MTTINRLSAASLLRSALASALMANLIWINASEVFRYFVFIMPMMREAHSAIPNVAPMNWPVFLIWGVWNTILVFVSTVFPWLFYKSVGSSLKNAILSGSFVWLAVFVLFWLGLFNMNLATPQILLTALPLAWFEMIVAAFITRWFWLRDQ